MRTLGYIVGAIIGLAFVVVFTIWVLWFMLAVLVLGVLAWACGMKITVSQNDKKIGYIRWTKFYPHEH